MKGSLQEQGYPYQTLSGIISFILWQKLGLKLIFKMDA